MVDEDFRSVSELYIRVLPALRIKKKELARNQMKFINEKDIWSCLRDKYWRKEASLTLYDIVNSILNLKEEEILEYMSNKIARD